MRKIENKLDPYWITGFVDAEGCFTVSIFEDGKFKWRIIPSFQIELHIRDYDLLLQIKSFFNGVGNIYIRSNNKSAYYKVNNINSISGIVLSHFDNYPLITKKYSDFIIFKNIIRLIKNKEHLTDEGLDKIINLKASLNNGIPDKLKDRFIVQKVPRVKVGLPELINFNWFAGFFSGEGCFFIEISKCKTTKVGYYTKLRISIGQHIRDEFLVRSFIDVLDCGFIYKPKNEDFVCYNVSKFEDIYTKIIPFFKTYKVIGTKSLDFKDFCEAACLIKNKTHLTQKGLENIQKIKFGMNKGRSIFKYLLKVIVVQLVRTSICGIEGSRFDPEQIPI